MYYTRCINTSSSFVKPITEPIDLKPSEPICDRPIQQRACRSGVISLQKHSIAFERAGYGLHYDKYYGGI